MRTANFVNVVASIISDCSLPPAALILEITERTLLDPRDTHGRTMDRLQVLGTRLALDDFGTGYSSLAYLTRYPINVLKIDRMFASTINNDPRAAALVQGILTITHSLDLQSVAEGIETDEQLQLLTTMGSQLGQGYLFSPPVPATTITSHLTHGTPWNALRRPTERTGDPMTDSVADHRLGGNSNPDDMNPCLVETGGRVMEELMDGLDADEKDSYAIGVS